MLESFAPMLHFPRPTYPIRPGSGSLNPSNASKRFKKNIPGGLQLKDQNLGVSGQAALGLEGPLRDALLVSSPEVAEPTETGVGNPVQSQGVESYWSDLPEPSSRQPGTRSMPSPARRPPPTTHHPPSQPAGLCTPLSSPQGEPQAPLPPDAARWNAGVRPFPEVSPGWPPPANQHRPGAPCVPPPALPSQSGSETRAPRRGRISGIKGTLEIVGSAGGKTHH